MIEIRDSPQLGGGGFLIDFEFLAEHGGKQLISTCVGPDPMCRLWRQLLRLGCWNCAMGPMILALRIRVSKSLARSEIRQRSSQNRADRQSANINSHLWPHCKELPDQTMVRVERHFIALRLVNQLALAARYCIGSPIIVGGCKLAENGDRSMLLNLATRTDYHDRIADRNITQK